MKIKLQISADDLFLNINKAWLQLLVFGFVGALTAFFIGKFLIQPVYVSDAKVSVGINFKQVGHLSQYEQDQYIGLVEALFLSDTVTQKTLDSLSTNGVDLSIEEFKENRVLEREINNLIFKYKNNQPEPAKKIVSAWVNVAFSELEIAYDHATSYHLLMNRLSSYEKCIERAANLKYGYFCDSMITLLPSDDELSAERENSRGIFPGLVFDQIDNVGSNPVPVQNQTNLLVLAGFFLGLFFKLTFLIFFHKTNNEL